MGALAVTIKSDLSVRVEDPARRIVLFAFGAGHLFHIDNA
jgi:hypothetical protein